MANSQYYIDVSTSCQSDDPTPDTYVTRKLTSVNNYASQISSEQDRIKSVQQSIPVDVPIINKDDIPKGLKASSPEGGISSAGNLGP